MPGLLAKPWYERPLTHRDLEDLPEDGNRYEVIDGVLYVTPFPNVAHQWVATEFVAAIATYLVNHPIGRAFLAGTKVVLDEFSGVGPDLVFIANRNLVGLEEDGYYGAPDLAVEITSSKPRLDRIVKYQKYAAAGVPEYWIVDPKGHRLQVYKLARGKYRLAAEHVGGGIFEPTRFPGLRIDMARVWAGSSPPTAAASSPSGRRAPRSAKPPPRRRR